MSSTFGWLDTDESRRDAMLRIVELFKDEDTVDDLGIGSIRDAISDALFPGTSVLHTRLRYVLFVPWLLQQAATSKTPEAMKFDFRRLEIRLIGSLLKGGETTGVIGGRARDALKRTPSAAYWAALHRYGMRPVNTSVDGFFRRAMTRRTLGRTLPEPDDPGSGERLDSGLDHNLPPAPSDLLHMSTFELTPDERSYVSDRLTMSTKGSMLAWLVEHPQSQMVDFIWELDIASVPERLRDMIEQARLFREVIGGAPVLYNLMLAEKTNNAELTTAYTDDLSDWHDRAAAGPLTEWDSRLFWLVLQRVGSEIRPPTREFVESWVAEARSGGDLATRTSARRLIANRETRLKGGRARLVNQSALDRWRGASGLLRLDYRWRVSQTLLKDLHESGAP